MTDYAIGGPWDGTREITPEIMAAEPGAESAARRKQIVCGDGTTITLWEMAAGLLYTNELGQETPLAMIVPTGTPGVYQIGTGFFRITPV